MNNHKTSTIIKIIALREGVSEEQILADMEFAILSAYRESLKEGDPEKLKLWNEIAPDGNPTVEGFLVYASKKVKQGLQTNS